MQCLLGTYGVMVLRKTTRFKRLWASGTYGSPPAVISYSPVLSSWVDAIANRKRNRVRAATRVILGDREVRTPSAVWFEQSDRAKAIEQDQRCYGFTNMVEQPRRASGPPAAMKVLRGELDETQEAVREFVTVRI